MYTKKEDTTLAEIEQDLIKNISKSYDLYHHILLLLSEIQHTASFKIDAAKNRLLTSKKELNPNTRFIENPIFKILQNNRKFQIVVRNNLISWNDSPETIAYFYNAIIKTNIYQDYMNAPQVSFEDHKNLILDIFGEVLVQDDVFFQTLEDKNIFWNSDFELILSIVHKTIRNIKENTKEENNILFSIYNEEEDTEFAKKLLRKTILENQENIDIINKFIFNWDIERISDMDKLIMSTAISELKHFPSIPIKVTLDEYIEITKSYSSPKSGAFINGVLDKTVSLLKENNQIIKTGRGLME